MIIFYLCIFFWCATNVPSLVKNKKPIQNIPFILSEIEYTRLSLKLTVIGSTRWSPVMNRELDLVTWSWISPRRLWLRSRQVIECLFYLFLGKTFIFLNFLFYFFYFLFFIFKKSWVMKYPPFFPEKKISKLGSSCAVRLKAKRTSNLILVSFLGNKVGVRWPRKPENQRAFVANKKKRNLTLISFFRRRMKRQRQRQRQRQRH